MITILGSKGLIGAALVHAIELQGKLLWCPTKDNETKLFSQPLGTVYYCAGLTADYKDRPFDTVEAHVSLLARILREAEFDRLIYLSSTRLYDSLPGKLGAEEGAISVFPGEPRHLYDISKLLGENLCLTASKNRAVVVRLSCVIGDSPDSDGFIPTLLKQAIGSKEIEIASSPFLKRDYIGIQDVVNLLLRIADSGKESIYNIASGYNIDNRNISTLIEELIGSKVFFKHQNRIEVPVIDIQRIENEFAFKPTAFRTLLLSLIASLKIS